MQETVGSRRRRDAGRWTRLRRIAATATLASACAAVCAAIVTPAGAQPAGRGAVARAPAQHRAQARHHAPAGRAARHQTVVSLTFDDADADQMVAARTLWAHGMRGTFYIITGAVGAPGYMTMADLRELAADGDEIGGHTVSHLSLPQLDPAEVRRQVCASRSILTGWGFQVRSFAYPDATYDPAVEAVVRDCGFNSARIGNGLLNGPCPACAAAESLPPQDPYAVRTPGQLDVTWSLRDIEGAVTNAEAHGGGWVPFVFHHVCTDPSIGSCGSLSITPDALTAFVGWLGQRVARGTVVETVGDVAGGPVRPLVAAAAAPRHGVVNASLELFGGTAAVSTATESTNGIEEPTCWMQGGYGQNTVEWQRVPGGHDGHWAQRVTMTSHHSGDAKLLEQFDLGQCALPVKPGALYVIGAWYESTVRTQFALYYRTASGRWVYWTSSPFFAGAAHWSHATWQVPPIPAGASGMSFGLSVAAVGTLSTDDYSIRADPVDVGRILLGLLVLVAGSGAAYGLYASRMAWRAMASRRSRQIAGAWRSRSSSSSSSP